MNQHLHEPFRGDARGSQFSESEGDGKGLGPVFPERHPGGDPTNLVTRSIEDDSVRGKSGAQSVPDAMDLTFVVLAQDVECANHVGGLVVGKGHFEPAANERDPRVRPRLSRVDPLGVNLDSDDSNGRDDARQAFGEFQGGVRCGTVSQVDDDGRGHRSKSGVPREPSIGTPKTVRSRCTAGDSTDYHPTILAG